LVPLNLVADPGLGTKHAVERGVDVAVTGVAANVARLTSEGPGRAISDDRSEPVPTRLGHDVGVTSRHEVGPKANGQVGEASLDLGGCVLSHHGDGLARSEQVLHAVEVRSEDCTASSTALPSKTASANAMPRLVVVGADSSCKTTA
jgi:hypothetical protein